MRFQVVQRGLPGFVLTLALLAGGLAQADVLRITYDLDGSKFEIRNTPFGAGDGSFDVGPGNLVIDYSLAGDDLVDGAISLRSYSLLLQFTSGTTGLQITTDLTTTANFSAGQLFAEGGLDSGVITWTQSFPYNAQGSNTCVGGFCGFAGFQDGVPQVIDSEDPFTFTTFRFETGGPQAGAGFAADEVRVPGNDSADTFLLLRGTELSRVRIDTTPPTIALVGDANVSVPCGGAYVDAGATASDNFSIGAVVSTGGDIVDTSTPGVYVLTYNVADSAGNPAAEVTRTVTVEDNCATEEGSAEGEGVVEGEGDTEGNLEGSFEGVLEGEGAADGEGVAEGEGAAEGEGVAEGEGISEGEGTADGEGLGEGEGAADGEGAGEGAADGEVASEGTLDGEGLGEGVDEGEGAIEGAHSADTNANGVIELSEVLRIIQIYNASEFHCQAGTEDGFQIGDGDRNCLPHSADSISKDWMIDLSELLRVIQLYAFRGYRVCDEEGDGFCAE